MLPNHKRWGVVPGLLFVALLAACNQERLSPDRSGLGRPSKKVTIGAFCPAAKMTGGGRIDAPFGGPDKNPPSSHLYETFGAHVISNGLNPDNSCAVKGSLEWVDHRPAFIINGRPLN